MGNFFKTKVKEKKLLKNVIESNDKKIKEIYDKIKLKKDIIEIENSSNKANLITQELKLYEQLFKYNNTKEDDILDYLLLNFEQFKTHSINQ